MRDTRAKDFANLLVELGACLEARMWARGKTMAEAWAECERLDWLVWLVHESAGRRQFPTWKRVVEEFTQYAVKRDAKAAALAHYLTYQSWGNAMDLLEACGNREESFAFLRSHVTVRLLQKE